MLGLPQVSFHLSGIPQMAPTYWIFWVSIISIIWLMVMVKLFFLNE